jgi:hypothetical protein
MPSICSHRGWKRGKYKLTWPFSAQRQRISDTPPAGYTHKCISGGGGRKWKSADVKQKTVTLIYPDPWKSFAGWDNDITLLHNGITRLFAYYYFKKFAVHLKHSWPSAVAKPLPNDLVHTVSWQCIFALSMCWALSLCLQYFVLKLPNLDLKHKTKQL